MQALEASRDLNEDPPDVVFFEQGVVLLMVTNHLEEVSIVRVLHHYAIKRLWKEGVTRESARARL